MLRSWHCLAEGQAKAEVKLNLDNITLPMIKLACHSAVSWEVISDYDRFTSYLQQELPLQMIDVENQQLLYEPTSASARE